MSYSHSLTDDEKRELLRIARTAVREWAYTHRLPPGKPHKESLLEPAGVFVSLHRGKALRGCIGQTEAISPIFRTVQEMAVAAATRDPRFGPVADKELDDITFEVSVLSGFEPISGPADVIVGTHGVVVEAGTRRGLLLPQVAPEQGWNAEELLVNACRKAGLPDDAWQSDATTVQVFTAQVFSEEEYPPVDPMSLLG